MSIKFRNLRNNYLIGIWFSVLFASLQFRVVSFVLNKNLIFNLEAAEGVINGTPHWRVYQSRILGPLLFEGFKFFIDDRFFAYSVTLIILLIISSLIVWHIGIQRGGLNFAFGLLFILHGLFTYSLSYDWLYIWDFISLIIFLLFIEGVISKKPTWWFMSIWSVGILNHENAVFICTYLIADSIIKWIFQPKINDLKKRNLNYRKLILGFVCALLSVSIVEFLRDKFLIEAIAPKLFGINWLENKWPFQLFNNLNVLKLSFSSLNNTPHHSIPILAYLLSVVLIAVLIFIKNPNKYGGFSLNYLFFISCLFIFGILYESRIYINLIPLCIFAAVVFQNKKQT
tara:strand:- start:125 stop:1150 length:1026 start_codon:yes stop_codon:yes gene_type:complete